MHYKLLGFTQSDSARRYVFERVGTEIVPAAFTVVVDLALARQFRISLQELPSACSRLLESGSDDQPGATVFLTDSHLTVHAAANLAAAQQEAAKRALRSHRGALAHAQRSSTRSLAGEITG